jgi:hypothetical protein
MAAQARMGWIATVLRLLPPGMVAALDGWSRALARRKAAARRARMARRK